jgi:hypothetical protein
LALSSAYHADAVYKFSIHGEPGSTASSIRSAQSQSPIVAPNRKRRKLRRAGQEPERNGSTSPNGDGSEYTPQNVAQKPPSETSIPSRQTQETPATARGDRDSNNADCLTEGTAPSTTTDMQNSDNVAKGADDVERFLEEYISPRISDAEAARDRESATSPGDVTSFHDVLDTDHVSEDKGVPRHGHSIGSPSADDNTITSSSEDEVDVESESDLAMDLDREIPSSSEESEDVEVGRAASLLQRFEDALVENQEDEDEDEDNGESEAESEGAMEDSVKEGALVNSWLAQPIVYPVQRYSGTMNVEVRKYSLTPKNIRSSCDCRL